MQLRPYQTEAADTIVSGLDETPNPLVSWPTGLGKTILFCAVAQRLNARSLIIAHRDELIRQAVDKVQMVWPEASVGIVKAQENDTGKQITVASIQTISNWPRLLGILKAGEIDLTIVDEAHHVAANTYQKVLQSLGHKQGTPVLGVTATPYRADNKSLLDTFDRIAHRITLLDAIKSGWLCNLKALQVQMAYNLDDVQMSGGDFDADDLGRVMMDAATPQLIGDAVWEYARDRQGLIFLPTVQMAYETAKCCHQLGVITEVIEANTKPEKRKAILGRFHAGETQYLANMGVLTEGFDAPQITTIVVARPTTSMGLFTQMIGRGTRLYPNKEHCLILDCVGQTKKHNLANCGNVVLEGFSHARQEQFNTGSSTALELILEAEGGHLTATPKELFNERAYAWVQTSFGFVLGLGKREYGWVQLSNEGHGGWAVTHITPTGRERLWNGPSLEYAQARAEELVRLLGANILAIRSAEWRETEISPGQQSALGKWRVPQDRIRLLYSKGEAADLLTKVVAEADWQKWCRMGGRHT